MSEWPRIILDIWKPEISPEPVVKAAILSDSITEALIQSEEFEAFVPLTFWKHNFAPKVSQ